jgi:hypothetical protein
MTVDSVVFILAGLAVVIPVLILVVQIIKGLYENWRLDKADIIEVTFYDGRVFILNFKEPNIDEFLKFFDALK